jgi:hypothetical protein
VARRSEKRKIRIRQLARAAFFVAAHFLSNSGNVEDQELIHNT